MKKKEQRKKKGKHTQKQKGEREEGGRGGKGGRKREENHGEKGEQKENDRRALSLLLHKRKDMVTTISCCFFSRGPLGRNIFDIRLLPIPSLLVVHHQGMDRPAFSL